MKRGFTLIELIAVILILGFIALITVPKALDVIEDSKKESVVNSAKVYVKAVNEAIINERMNKNKIDDGTYSIMNNGLLCIGIIQADSTCSGKTIDLGLKSNNFSCGYVRVNDGKVSELENVQSSKYSINKTNNNYTVEEGYKCFSGCFAITEKTITEYYDNENNSTNYNFCPKDVVLPEGITSIASNYLTGIFEGKELTSLKLSNTLKTIGDSAFRRNQISSLIIPDSVEKIGVYAFMYNKISSLKLGSSVKRIEGTSFWGNQITGKLELPNSLEYIGPNAFENNKISGDLVLSESLEEIESDAFNGNQISSLVLNKKLTKLGASAFANNQISGSIKLPSSLVSMGAQAFANNKISGEIIIPNNLELISKSVFLNNQISSVIIGKNITNIDDSAFGQNYLTHLEIPDNVTRIGSYAFTNNKLKKVTIGSGITEIGSYAFYGNDELEEVIINRESGTVNIASYYAFPIGTKIKFSDGVEKTYYNG